MYTRVPHRLFIHVGANLLPAVLVHNSGRRKIKSVANILASTIDTTRQMTTISLLTSLVHEK